MIQRLKKQSDGDRQSDAADQQAFRVVDNRRKISHAQRTKRHNYHESVPLSDEFKTKQRNCSMIHDHRAGINIKTRLKKPAKRRFIKWEWQRNLGAYMFSQLFRFWEWWESCLHINEKTFEGTKRIMNGEVEIEFLKGKSSSWDKHLSERMFPFSCKIRNKNRAWKTFDCTNWFERKLPKQINITSRRLTLNSYYSTTFAINFLIVTLLFTIISYSFYFSFWPQRSYLFFIIFFYIFCFFNGTKHLFV